MTDPGFVIDETELAELVPGLKADDARTTLRDHLTTITAQVLRWHDTLVEIASGDFVRPTPPHVAIRITTGTGKSALIRQAIAWFIAEAKRLSLPHRVLILLPTHRLANEARSMMPPGVSSMIWQGRKATRLGTEEKMCLNPDAVDAAEELGLDVEKAACKNGDARCPLLPDCAYQQQKAAARKAEVVFAAHEILFQVPKALGKNFGLVVIDEAFWQDGLMTKSSLVIESLAEELDTFPVRHPNGTKRDDDTWHLGDLVGRVQGALTKMPDGYVQRQPLLDAGLLRKEGSEKGSCYAGYRMEWDRRYVRHGVHPGVDQERLKEAVEKYGFLGRLSRRAEMWRLLDDLINSPYAAGGRLRLETEKTKDGPVRKLRLLGRKEVVEDLANCPIIHADATLQLELSQYYLPDLELACDLVVDAPHMRITQVIGKRVGKSALEPKKPGKRKGKQRGAWRETPEEAEARVGRKRQDIVDTVRHIIGKRRGVVITYEAIENDFKVIAGVETAHFGNIEGLDRWRDVEVLVMVGRPLPAPGDVRDMAAAIAGTPVFAGAPIYRDREIAPGHTISCTVYADRDAELIRQAITEAAIVQAVGRARGVNRTGKNPVEVFMILSDTVVPSLPVNAVVRFDELKPDAIDQMVAQGLAPQWPGDAAKLYPKLFTLRGTTKPSREAAKKAYQRASLMVQEHPHGIELGTSLNKYISINGCPQFGVRYRPKGRGSIARIAWLDPAKLSDVRSVLENALGELDLFEMIEPTIRPDC